VSEKISTTTRRIGRGLGLAALIGCGAVLAAPAQAASSIDFKMVRTKGLPKECAEHASATVHVDTSPGFAEKLVIKAKGFKPGTPLVLFAIQVPNAPFGLGWYVGDLETGADGSVTKTFISRFNVETFAVAVGTPVAAPQTHPTDAKKNPVFAPVHTYHLGAWFNSPADAKRAGCPTGVTPFNGEHTAGVQVLNTGTFPDLKGPLSKVD
jgi:hypothetical protein